MNGVCPSPNSNMTVEDCIKQVEGLKKGREALK